MSRYKYCARIAYTNASGEVYEDELGEYRDTLSEARKDHADFVYAAKRANDNCTVEVIVFDNLGDDEYPDLVPMNSLMHKVIRHTSERV